jgi:putative endonuclease
VTAGHETGDLARREIQKGCHSARSEAQSQNPPQKHMTKTAYVYILASQRHGTLYTGVTSDLARRVYQHRHHLIDGFTHQYNVTRLVWFSQSEDIAAAIALEKKIKNRGRPWKVRLIESINPDWTDLAAAWTNAGGEHADVHNHPLPTASPSPA